jgi:Ca2+-binding RTX toxin-like protein
MFFDGTSGIDIVPGTADDDEFYGQEGNDQLFGEGGNDFLDGEQDDDLVDGGDGNDNLLGGAGNDTLLGGAGNDYLVGEAGDDSIDGGSGTYDTAAYYGAASGVIANLATGIVTGGDGNDTLAGVENLQGSPFADFLTGDSGANGLYAGAGNDTIVANDGNDNFDGNEGDDSLNGGNGDDYMSGDAGNDTIDGGNGIDMVVYSSATTAIVVNLLAGTATDGLGGTDTLINVENVQGSSFNDSIQGNTAVNFISPEGGNDTVIGGGGRDVVSYESATSAVTVNLLAGTATGGGGNDSLTGIGAVHATAFNDSITLGNTFAGYVFGRAGNDLLVGGTLDDGFIGGSGNDTMIGGTGFDNIAYDNDLFDMGPAATGVGVTVNMSTGTATDNWGHTDTFSSIEVVVGSPLADMLIGGNPLNGSGATDGFEGFTGGAGNDTINGGAGFDRAQYTSSPSGVNVTLGGLSAGTASDGFGGTDTLINIEEVRASNFGDVLTGSSDNYFESFEGRGGNDTINGNGGTDRVSYSTSPVGVTVNLQAGTASDGFGGTDTFSNIEQVRGSEFGDTLIGNTGNNDLDARAGNDSLSGGAGEDFLRGGTGNDTIDGGANSNPSNTANFNPEFDGAYYGDATAAVTVVLGATGAAGTATGGGGADVLIDIENVVGSNFNDLISGTNRAMNEIIRGGLGDDTLRGGDGSGPDAGFNLVDYRAATGGVVVNLALGEASGADGNDVISGFKGIIAGPSGDVLIGSSADEYFEPRAGNDTISGGAGIDRLSFWDAATGVTVNLGAGTASGGGGNDVMSGIENLRGSEFSDHITGDGSSNEIQARAGNDTVFGGAGEDTIYGGFGDDVLDGGTHNPLLGSDWVTYAASTGAVDINLATGLATGAEGTDTLANFEGVIATSFAETLTGDALDNVLRGNGGDDTMDGGAGNDWVDFVSASASVTANLVSGTSSGADGNDVFTNIERIRGSHFNDTLTGDSGNNRLRGNRGDDLLDGGDGTDGTDYYNATGPVTVDLASGTATGADGSDTLVNIENILGSFNWGDMLTGNSLLNVIDGRGGNDTISGGDGDDTLQGGDGNDSLDGGEGNDVAVYVGNFVDYTVSVEAGNDDVIVSGPEGTDRLRNIELLQFADRNFVIREGTETADQLTGTAESELVHLRAGDDSIDGGLGDDALYGDEGTDSLLGGQGDDFLDGGTGADSMVGGNGDDTYVVDSAGDSVAENGDALALLKDPLADNPGSGVDTVIASINYTLGNFIENLALARGSVNLEGTGNSLSNVITGNAGSNTLAGKGGNDTIDGGEGVDTASYSGNRSESTLGAQGDAITVSSAAEGTDALTHVERLLFADGRVAIDIQGSTGLAAKVVGAIFGPAALSDLALVGHYLSLFDAGLTLEEGIAAAIASDRFAQSAGSHSNHSFVNYVYQNVAGFAPDAGTHDLLVGLLESGSYSQAGMGALAAETDYLLARIGYTMIAANGLAYSSQAVSAHTGGVDGDVITGTAAADFLFGRESNDVFTSAAGNDLIVGAHGIDRAIFSGPRSSSSVTQSDLGLVVAGGTDTDTLIEVERITFSDISLAYDIDGNAGRAAKIIGAMFGPVALQEEALVGEYLAMLDAGMAYEEVAGAAAASARFAAEAGSHGNAAFVDRVYFNIAGFLPAPSVSAPLVALLDGGGYSQAYLGLLAAEVDYNVMNVNLTGFAQTGLEYAAT